MMQQILDQSQKDMFCLYEDGDSATIHHHGLKDSSGDLGKSEKIISKLGYPATQTAIIGL